MYVQIINQNFQHFYPTGGTRYWARVGKKWYN